jgi:hypothetical protein
VVVFVDFDNGDAVFVFVRRTAFYYTDLTASRVENEVSILEMEASSYLCKIVSYWLAWCGS